MVMPTLDLLLPLFFGFRHLFFLFVFLDCCWYQRVPVRVPSSRTVISMWKPWTCTLKSTAWTLSRCGAP